MLYNDFITLKPISVKDTEFILELRNDLEIADQFFSDPPLYDFKHSNWLKIRSKDDLDFIVMEKQTQKRAGRIYITNIDYRHQKGEYGIVLHSNFRGKNLAYKASKLLLDHVFNNLPIQKIILKVFNDNQKAIKLYKKIGFSQEGYFKKDIYKKGEFKDVCQMALFKDNWFKKNGK